MPIKKKQRTTESDWKYAVENIESIVSESHIKTLVASTADEIKKVTNGKRCAYSWSGGKDSIALQVVCQLAGIQNSVFVRCDLEYTQFINWINLHKPHGCEIINTHQDIKWLAEHQDMLFPKDSRAASKWFKIVQHKGQELYFKKHNLDIIILGRRKADGNYVGNGSNVYTNKKGITRYSPLAMWTHEDVLGCIHYFNMPLPPIYDWKNGYLCGTHNFAARQWTGSVENGWAEVFDIEPEIVYNSARYIESARSFLNGKTEKKPNS